MKLSTLLLVGFVLGCFVYQAESSSRTSEPDREVLEAAVNHYALRTNDGLLLQNPTYSAPVDAEWFERSPFSGEELSTLVQSLNSRGGGRQLSDLDLPENVRLINQAEVEKLFSAGADEGWRLLTARYPERHLLAMSLPGYSDELRRAVILVSIGSGPLASKSLLLFLESTDDGWNVIREEVFAVA